jgi:hypothetical protein
MKNPIVWFEIYVNDIDRATTFYETVFNTKLSPMGDPTDQGMRMMSFDMDMSAHGSSGMLVQMPGMDAGKNSTIVYFYSEDCITEESRVVAAGGMVMKPKMSLGEYGFMSLCKDTEGNIFGLHSMQ